MKLTKRQLTYLLSQYINEGMEQESDIMLYSYVHSDALESVLFHGLAGSRGIIENKEILDSIFVSDKEKQSFVDRYDKNDITLQGPSVFFQKPSKDKILDIDPGHAVGKDQFTLLSMKLSEVSVAHGYQGLFGLELIPYSTDREYEKNKDAVEHILTTPEIKLLAKIPFEKAWENYVSGFFAGNVPHAIILMENGVVPPTLLTIAR